MPVGAVAEAMQHRLGPAPALSRRQLEHRPVSCESRPNGRAVEIAGGIEDQAGLGIDPVRAVAEAMQHRLRPAPALLGRQLEHRPDVVNAAAMVVP